MNKKALFIYTHSSTFVRGDISILKKRYNIKEYQFKNNPKAQLPLSLIKLFFYLLINIHKFNFIYIWFADYHSYLPSLMGKLFNKKVFIVIGGYDICREKRYNYGSFSNPLRGNMTLHSIKWAYCNLCVSKNIERTIKAIAPKAQTKTVYNGVEITALPESFTTPVKATDLQKSVLCVALISTVQTFYIKGIDRYNKVAALLPNTPFILVGCNLNVFKLAGIKPSSNLKIVEAVPPQELIKFYRTSHVYCQFSRRESFSLSLAEAMSHKLIPIISNTGGMPEVTGGLGFSLYFYKNQSNSNNPNSSVSNSELEAAQLIEEALKLEKNNIIRERIIYNFTLKERERKLFSTL